MTPCPELSVIFRCDGSPEIGPGHIVRCLALAYEFHEVHNCRISFAMRTGPPGIKMVEKKATRWLFRKRMTKHLIMENGLMNVLGKWRPKHEAQSAKHKAQSEEKEAPAPLDQHRSASGTGPHAPCSMLSSHVFRNDGWRCRTGCYMFERGN